MASKTDICNLALARLGAENIISIDDDTKRAKTLKAVYDLVRDIVLADHPWNFAITRATLALLTTAPEFGYCYAYQLPTDPFCLRVLGIVGDTAANVDPGIEYKIEGQRLLTNVSPCNIKYIARVTVEGVFTPSFCSALALRLAAEVAYKLTGNASLKGEAMKEYQLELGKAKSQNAQEVTPEAWEDTSWADSRL
jgi:hypothetical protein